MRPTTETSGDAAAPPDPKALPPFARLLSTSFGLGLLRPGPGTWTSFVAAAPLLLPSLASTYAVVVAAAALASYAACVLLARHKTCRATLDRDPGWFTLDEVCGMWVAAWRPEAIAPKSLVVAFALFRLFDVLKPPPIRRSQDVGAGHGIVLDDALAGLYALGLGLLFDAAVA